jgi:hypothetical protein
VGVNREFDHLPESARNAWQRIAKRLHTALRHCRQRCRQIAFELDIERRKNKSLERELDVERKKNRVLDRELDVERKKNRALDRENALLTAQVDVLRMALSSPRGTVPRPTEHEGS